MCKLSSTSSEGGEESRFGIGLARYSTWGESGAVMMYVNDDMQCDGIAIVKASEVVNGDVLVTNKGD